MEYEMIDTNDYEEERNPIRKVLKSLPKVHASDDFELRLKRRLNQGEFEKTSLSDILFSPKRVPAYSLSLIAIVMTSVIIYYSIIRTGVAPDDGFPKPKEMMREKQPETLSVTQSPAHVSGVPQRKFVVDAPKRFPQEGQSATSLPSKESTQDALSKRGLLREVGGTQTRSTRSLEIPELGFFQKLQSAAKDRWGDSVARADSVKRDSLKRFQESQQKNPK